MNIYEASKMATLLAVIVSCEILFSQIRLSVASTHWIVTEDGRVNSQVDSVFNMKRPYDLVAFMKQEERANMLDHLKQELLARKDEIDKTEDRDTGLEEKFYKSDLDCLAAGKHLPDLDLYISTVLPLENKGIRPEDYIPSASSTSVYMPPDCTIYTDLPYSVHAFEHLEGMKDREKLTGTPELGLKNAITYQDTVDEYGHRIYEAFKQNKTSWVLFNMAAFYWRIKGDPFNVIECVRRALHYSPRMQKDVALISLANVLHRARYSNEAAVVVHAALDVSKELNVNHFTLGNIYAVLGEYNKSVICFENTLKIQPDFEAAAKRKHAVLCHAKLESALEQQHRSLQRTLNDLKDYQKKHDYWQQQNDKLLAEQVPMDVKVSQHVAYEELKIKEMSAEIGEYCKMGDKDGKHVLMCSWGKKNDPALGMDFTAPSEKLTNKDEIPTEVENVTEVTTNTGEKLVDYSKPMGPQKYTEETVKVPRYQGTSEYLKDEEWPSKEECDEHVKKVPDARNLSSTYLSPENKGFLVKPLLTEAQGLKPGDEHPLPWYPPVCVTLLDIPEGNTKSHDDIESVSYSHRSKIPLKLIDQWHTETLLNHVNDGKVTVEEIGQRILTAIKKNIGPKWVLFNIAGLYWRIIGNNYHGIECFRRAIYTAPEKYADVPEVNLANILYRWGRYDDAHRLLGFAASLNKYEPATQFMLGNIMWAKNNYTGAAWRYQNALEADPQDQEAVNTLRALKCYLKYHHSAQSQAPLETQTKENGEEKCVIETRMRGRPGECESSCTQTCTVTPMSKSDTCGHGVEGPGGGTDKCEKKGGPNQPHANTGTAEDIMFAGDFTARLDEIAEKYQKMGICDGEECNQLRVQQNGQMPHIKLDYVNGDIHQKLIFAQSPNEITVEPHECVIFNDGSKSNGCNRQEYQAYIKDYDNFKNNPDALVMFLNGRIKKFLKVDLQMNKQDKQPAVDLPRGPEGGQPRMPPYQGEMFFDSPKEPDVEDGEGTRRAVYQLPDTELPEIRQDKQPVIDLPKGPEGGQPRMPPYQGEMIFDSPKEPDVEDGEGTRRAVYQLPDTELPEIRQEKQSVVPMGQSRMPPYKGEMFFDSSKEPDVEDGEGTRRAVYQLPDSELPDTRKYSSKRLHLPLPKLEECKKLKKTNMLQFSSSWLSLSAKKINIKDYIDFKSKPTEGPEEPLCDPEILSEVMVDHLPGLIYRDKLDYASESGLRMVLRKAEGVPESIESAGTKIALALKQNSTSWVAANIASLYWRVKGQAQNALECLRVALYYAPESAQDALLLGVANVLQRAGYINDAIVTLSYGLQMSRDVVVSQFTMANLYASKEQWDLAAMFYESTLGLQADFQPAKDRLRAIQCMRALQKPEVWSDEDPNVRKYVIT